MKAKATVSVTIYRWWARGRLWLDANDVVSALKVGGYADAAAAIEDYVEKAALHDRRK